MKFTETFNNFQKKRKSSIQVKEHDENNTESSSKVKAIKCGVCDKMLQELEWEDHISSDHCYVAWQDGAAFVSSFYLFTTFRLVKVNNI